MKGATALYKIPKCSNCEITWGVKLYFDENTSEVASEYINFDMKHDINKESMSYKTHLICLRCKFEVVENAIFSTEQEFLDTIDKLDKK